MARSDVHARHLSSSLFVASVAGSGFLLIGLAAFSTLDAPAPVAAVLTDVRFVSGSDSEMVSGGRVLAPTAPSANVAGLLVLLPPPLTPLLLVDSRLPVLPVGPSAMAVLPRFAADRPSPGEKDTDMRCLPGPDSDSKPVRTLALPKLATVPLSESSESPSESEPDESRLLRRLGTYIPTDFAPCGATTGKHTNTQAREHTNTQKHEYTHTHKHTNTQTCTESAQWHMSL